MRAQYNQDLIRCNDVKMHAERNNVHTSKHTTADGFFYIVNCIIPAVSANSAATREAFTLD